MLHDGSLKSRLWKFRHFISVLLTHSAVAEAFSGFGIETHHVLEYQQLFDRCLVAFFEAKNDRSSGLAVTDALQAQINLVKKTYRQHLTLARHVMTSRGDRARLELRGPRENSTASWIYQARAFYLNMGDAQLARLARFKITRAHLDQVLLQLDALESQLSAVHIRRVQMMQKTRERDAIFDEMAVAARDLEVVARVLSEDHPHLLGLLMCEPRSGSGNNGSTTLPDPEPLPAPEPAPESAPEPSSTPGSETEDDLDDSALTLIPHPEDQATSDPMAGAVSIDLVGTRPIDLAPVPDRTKRKFDDRGRH